MAVTPSQLPFHRDARPTTLAADGDGQPVLDALEDPACRTILEATGEDARSAGELSEVCELPLSTVYRKLELLTDAGLLAESIRIRRSGKHTSEYRRAVDEVHVTMGANGGIELSLDATGEAA